VRGEEEDDKNDKGGKENLRGTKVYHIGKRGKNSHFPLRREEERGLQHGRPVHSHLSQQKKGEGP